MAYRFKAIDFSLEEQVYAELCHCSCVYMVEAGVGTRSLSLLGISFLIWGSSQKHLDCYIWQKLAEYFGKSEVPLL